MEGFNFRRYHILIASILAFIFLFAVTRIFAQAVFTSIVFAIILTANKKRIYQRKKTKYAFLAEENYFSNTLLLLVATIIQADDKREDSEFKYIESALLEHFQPKRVVKMVNYIKAHAEDTPINYRKICKSIRFEFPLSSKIQLMHLLIGIAAADGLVTKTEQALLQDIAIQIRLPKATFDSLFKMFHFRYEGEEKRQQRKIYSYKLRLSEAYGILEISEDASVEEIKKAYRKMALKHHPDRVIHLGSDYQKSAKEKFQIISDAYEFIKKKKGFS